MKTITRSHRMVVPLLLVLAGTASAQTAPSTQPARAKRNTPAAKERAIDDQQKQEAARACKRQVDEILSAKFDPSTLRGAIGAFTQAIYKKDPVGMADFYNVKAAPDDHFALMTAKAVLAENDFNQAVRDRVNPNSTFVMLGHLYDAEMIILSPWIQPQEHGDSAVVAGLGGQGADVWFHKVNGVWKQDVSLPEGRTLAERSEDLEEDVATVTRVTRGVNQGQFKTANEVRDALGNSGLNCFHDSTFSMEMQAFAKPAPTEAAPPMTQEAATQPARSQDPRTPGGAMTRFIGAVEKGDLATVADSLFVPNDKDGVAALAMGRDYIVGVKYVRAVQRKFPQFETQGHRFSALVIGPESLREYSDDEWCIPKELPSLAVSADKFLGVPDAFNGGKTLTMTHEWTPIMRLCPDGHWRLGPWYPEIARQLSFVQKNLKAKDDVLESLISDMKTGKINSIDDLSNALDTQLNPLGLDPIRTKLF